MNWAQPQVVVRAADTHCVVAANKLAQIAGLPVQPMTMPAESVAGPKSSPWTLLVQSSALSLIRPDGLSVEIDFIRGKANRRTKETNFNSQPLARALGLKNLRKRGNQTPTVIDATAGLGTDGWMMASLGCDNTPTVVSNKSPAYNISVLNTNSVDFLNNDDNASADIIYLDPMYPPTRSKALVKKGLQLLHDLIGPDTNGPNLLSAALKKAKYRVVENGLQQGTWGN